MHQRAALTILYCAMMISPVAAQKGDVKKYARFRVGSDSGPVIAYGLVEGDQIRQIDGDLFGQHKLTDKSYSLKEVKLLVPVQPGKVLAMAGNYRSHLGKASSVTTTITTVTDVVTDMRTGRTQSTTKANSQILVSGQVPKKFQTPQVFYKLPSCLVPNDANIVLPREAKDVHYEAEMVIVIGKKARNVDKNQALTHVFGVTCGNDISARQWQDNDVQWWRAKASDTFGPCGPYIVTGLDYDKLQMRLRHNGDVRQDTNTNQLIHNVSSIVSFVSRHVTLNPGDLIFTGTPGETAALSPGDVVEVEIEGIGTLKNRVVAE